MTRADVREITGFDGRGFVGETAEPSVPVQELPDIDPREQIAAAIGQIEAAVAADLLTRIH